jgi:P4 family phage/plasmid primase-like protien
MGRSVAGVDIDNCRDPHTGEISALAQALITILPGAYVEVSVSGTGIHIWFSYSGEMPAHACTVKDAAGKREFYHAGHYFAIGIPYEALGFINGTVTTDLTVMLPALENLYFPYKAPITAGDDEGPEAGWKLTGDDDELLRRFLAEGSKDPNVAFGNEGQVEVKVTNRQLWEADDAALSRKWPEADRKDGFTYERNKADFALSGKLNFYTGNDFERTLRIMMRDDCGLKRPKWDRVDYLPVRTIPNSRSEKVYNEDRNKTPLTSLTPVAATIAGGPKLLLSPTDRALLNVGTQHSIALIFAQRLEGKMLYDHTRGAWLEWDDTRWKVDRTRGVYNAIREICAEKNEQHKASMASASFCEGVEKHLKNDPKFARTSDQFDRDNYLLNTPAGTIDLRTGERRAHNPADLLTLCTSVAPSPEGGEEFNRFLSGITLGDVSLCNFHQVSLGACLSGAIELHYLTFWIGNGRNGKNTLGDLIQDAMGDYAKKIPASTLMSKSFESHPTEVANLKGVRLATSSEVNDGDHWDEARINEVTGDATLSGRVMRGDFFVFKRTHKHLIYGNYSPQLRSVSDGIRSRIKIVPFKASFVGHEDTDLPARLRQNLGYVMAWLIDGHRKWLENAKKLPACAAVEAESAQYFEQQATPALWLQERCELVPADGRSTPQLPRVSDLYRDYREWKERRGELPVSQKRWTDAAMRGFEKAHSNAGWHLRGLTLRPRVEGMPFGTGVPFPPPSKTVVQ